MASKKATAPASVQSKTSPSSVTCPRSRNGPSSVGGHQSFRPILPCGNKLLQQRWDQTYYDQHRKLVKTAKPMVDTKAPPKRNHVTTKWKKEQIIKERSEEINRDNMTLLNKMQSIMHTRGCVDHINSYVHHSLNQEQRQREQVRVARENMELLKRIEEVEPMYKVSEWIDDWQRKEELTNMITSFPNGLPAPELSVSPSTSPRHKASNADSTSAKSSISPKHKTPVAKSTCASKGGATKKSKAVDKPVGSISNNPSDVKTEENTPSKQQTEENTSSKQQTEENTSSKQQTEENTSSKQQTEENTSSKQQTEENTSSKQQAEEQEEPARAIQSDKELEVEKDPSQEATSTAADVNHETRAMTSSSESSKSSHQNSSASSTSLHSTTPEKE